MVMRATIRSLLLTACTMNVAHGCTTAIPQHTPSSHPVGTEAPPQRTAVIRAPSATEAQCTPTGSVPAVPSVRSTQAPSPFAALPGWTEDTIAEVLPAWRRTCERLTRTPDDRNIGRDPSWGTVAQWRASCASIPSEGADHTTVRQYFESHFTPSLVTFEGNPYGLFTGYYEPELRGSRRRHGRFTVPLYPRPADLVNLGRGVGRMVRGRPRPYWTRAQIAAGKLRRTRPIVWVDDPIDAFFLEIQGSGRVVLDDGTHLQLNYAASNGHPYVPLGRVLVERGAIERNAVSLQRIRAWLRAHPREAQSVMNQNPSYVFFRASDELGAHGAEGVVLTPGRSMAVDPTWIPLGVPLYIDLEPLEGVGPIRRLVVAQDTGGAIRGAVRGDLFWGPGSEAYDRAGRMRQRGRYWVLIPRTITSANTTYPRSDSAPSIATR